MRNAKEKKTYIDKYMKLILFQILALIVIGCRPNTISAPEQIDLKMSDAEIARILGYSRAYISLLWRTVKPFLITQLYTAENFYSMRQ